MGRRRSKIQLKVHTTVPDLTPEERGMRIAAAETVAGLIAKRLGDPRAQKFSICVYDADRDLYIYRFDP